MVQSSSFRSRFKDRKRSFSCACLLPTVWFWLILGVSLQQSSAGSAAGMAGRAWTSSASARRASLGPTVSSVSHCSVPFQSKATGVVPAGPLPLVRGGRWNNQFSEMKWNTWKKCWVRRMVFSWQSVCAWSAFVFSKIQITGWIHQAVLENPWRTTSLCIPLFIPDVHWFSFSLPKFSLPQNSSLAAGLKSVFLFSTCIRKKELNVVQAIGYLFGLADKLESKLFA